MGEQPAIPELESIRPLGDDELMKEIGAYLDMINEIENNLGKTDGLRPENRRELEASHAVLDRTIMGLMDTATARGLIDSSVVE